jgi:thiol-disulfide isomerase/thioredoxin
MKTSRRVLARTAMALLVLLACGPGNAADSSRGFEPATWLQGAEGLYDAILKLKDLESPPPLVVYFYTDWCGYCRQFERELLGTDPVKKYFEEVLTVRINPESGPQEREIASYYGVSGYPSFFVHSGRSKTLSAIDRMKMEGGRPVLKSPAEFIDTVRAAGAP